MKTNKSKVTELRKQIKEAQQQIEQLTLSNILVFQLTMPKVGSWKGNWSAESESYVIVKNFGISKIALQKTQEMLDIRQWHHNFGDGWVACVTARKVAPSEAKKLKKASSGFFGYDWMVDSIIKNGSIK